MTTKREEAGRKSLSGVATGRRLPPVHPGDVLLKEFIEPLELTRHRVAKGAGVPLRRITEICAGRRAMKADTALRLGRFFAIDARFWMNLQAQYDLEVAQRESGKRIESEVQPLMRGSRCAVWAPTCAHRPRR